MRPSPALAVSYLLTRAGTAQGSRFRLSPTRKFLILPLRLIWLAGRRKSRNAAPSALTPQPHAGYPVFSRLAGLRDGGQAQCTFPTPFQAHQLVPKRPRFDHARNSYRPAATLALKSCLERHAGTRHVSTPLDAKMSAIDAGALPHAAGPPSSAGPADRARQKSLCLHRCSITPPFLDRQICTRQQPFSEDSLHSVCKIGPGVRLGPGALRNYMAQNAISLSKFHRRPSL